MTRRYFARMRENAYPLGYMLSVQEVGPPHEAELG